MRGLERRDLVCAVQGARDVVEAVDQRLLRMRIELEAQVEPTRMRDPQVLEIDGQLVAGVERSRTRAIASGGSCTGASPLLIALARKMSPKRGCDDNSKTEVLERPGRVLARRATTEVPPGDQDRRVAILGVVQEKLGSRTQS